MGSWRLPLRFQRKAWEAQQSSRLGTPWEGKGDTVTGPKTQWSFWDVDVRKRRRVSAEESLGSKSSIAYQERPHGLQIAMPQQKGCPHPSELTSCQHLSQCWIWSCAFNVSRWVLIFPCCSVHPSRDGDLYFEPLNIANKKCSFGNSKDS